MEMFTFEDWNEPYICSYRAVNTLPVGY